MHLPGLALPSIDARVREVAAGRFMIQCIARRKFVALTPEEWVRQHILGYLTAYRSYPQALLAVERTFPYQGMPWRADVVAYNRKAEPVLLVECKAPNVSIIQSTFEQAGRYNLVVGARYVAVSNGIDHFCFEVDREKSTTAFLDDIPNYIELVET